MLHHEKLHLNKNQRVQLKNAELMSAKQLCFYCTSAPLRSHPQPRHYAPTTGLDPSPLQDFALLIRSLLLSGALGFRTFKPRLVRFSALFIEKLQWGIISGKS